MLSCVVINRPHSRRTPPSVFPYPIPILELTPPSSHKKLALSFHALTKCKFRIPFVLIFIQNARGGYPPSVSRSPVPLSPIFSETLFPALSYLSPRTGTAPARRYPVMSDRCSRFFAGTARTAVAGSLPMLLAALVLSPLGALAQSAPAPTRSTQSTASASKDRWLHVRVISSDAKGETVRVNVPLELAEKVLPAINKHRLHDGKVRIDDA